MTKPPLDQALHDLHDELERIAAGGELDEDRMLGLVGDVERQLEHPDAPEPEEGILASLRRWRERFELEHPRAAPFVNRLMQSLGDTGI